MTQTDELLSRGVENIIPGNKPLKELLESNLPAQAGNKLNIYLGIDPTATRIHIGHAVPLRKLQAFAELGHNVYFLIGDFTALIGDTSDKDAERPILTTVEIKKNFETYKKQAEKILDFSKVKVVHNSDWLKKLTFTDIIKLCQNFSAGDFVGRELIKKRLTDGKKVGLHELLYPVMQGYDSYHLDTDIQIGGTDQTFNMQAGRTLLWDLKKKESYVLAMGFLEGTDGRKMSKSWGNAIWLDDEPRDMYGKVMSLRDELIGEYFMLATSLPLEQVKKIELELKKSLSAQAGINPMGLKKKLAYQIVSELHSTKDAIEAQSYFEGTFQRGELIDIPEIKLPFAKILLVDLLTQTKLATSKSVAKRLLSSKAVEIDDKEVTDPKTSINLTKGIIIKVGKKKSAKISQI